MIKSYYIAAAAASLCLLLITVAVSSTIYILHDISNFYDEAQDELVEFKDLANTAWEYMTYDASPEELREAEQMEKEREERIRRSYDPAQIANYGRGTAAPSPQETFSDEEITGYDFVPAPEHEVRPPSSRPHKPNQPTIPRTIQGFKAPPPAATSTHRPPPTNSAYDNYGREPVSSRRPMRPIVTNGTPLPYNSINTATRINIPNNTPPPPRPASAVPRTQPPYQPNGGYDDGRQTPPSLPTQKPTTNSPRGNYPEDTAQAQPPSPSNTPRASYESENPPYEGSTQKPDYQNPTAQQTQKPRPAQVPGSGTPQVPKETEEPYEPGPRPGSNHGMRPIPGSQGRQEPRSGPGVHEGPKQTPESEKFGNSRPKLPQTPRPNTNRPSGNQCEMCGQQPNTCPPGPPGPRGRPGPPGFPGQDGPRGLRGLNGGYVEANPTPYPEDVGCIQCPIGAPGNPGPDGPVGPPGDDGQDGEQGTNGNDGRPGAPGVLGYQGMPGIPGRPGKPGTPGRKGQACRSIPGAPGKPGQIGIPGRPGDPGIDGEHGQDGSPGIQGPPGKDGMPGPDGPPGQSRPGPPGIDGGYCSCPKRSSKFDFQDGYNGDNRNPQRSRPRDHTVDMGPGKRPPTPERRQYGDEPDYERQPQRKPKYDMSAEMGDRREYRDEQQYERPAERRTPNKYVEIDSRKEQPYEAPNRQSDREPSNTPYEAPNRPSERDPSNTPYESSNRPSNRPSDRDRAPPRRRYEEEDNRYRGPYIDEPRPSYDNERQSEKNQKELKKIEINRNRGMKPQTRNEYEDNSYEDQMPKNNAHPPGIRRPKQEPRDEMPPKTARYDGDRYEDISMVVQPHKPTVNKVQEREWNRSNEQNRRDYEESSYTSDRKPEDSRENHRRSDDTTRSPLPTEQYYRRKNRFYQIRYYDKYLL